MPTSEYQAGGGALKLKGGAGIDKKRKKKRPKPTTDSDGNLHREDPSKSVENHNTGNDEISKSEVRKRTEERGEDKDVNKERGERSTSRGKTAAELRYEEMRRKRLDDRLKREGNKTHKQRVEELNKYLSNLSEHHDMPRIGPG